MNIIITGSQGFIGIELVRALRVDHNIFGIDRKTGADVKDIASIIDLFQENVSFKPDLVIHLAAQTSVFNENIDCVIHDNIYCFKKVVDYCNENNVKLIYASSSTAENATSVYGLTKKFNEEYAAIYCKNSIGIRFYNVYGNTQREDTLISKLVRNKEIVLFEGGEIKRRFTHVDNIVEGIIYAMDSAQKLLSIYNPKESTIKEVAEIVQEYKPLKISLTGEKRKYDCNKQCVSSDISNFNTDYIDIQEGIKRIFN